MASKKTLTVNELAGNTDVFGDLMNSGVSKKTAPVQEKVLEEKQESEVIVCRSGKPVVKITLIQEDVSRRIGGAKGQFVCPDDIDEYNDEIAKLFGVV